MYDRFFIKLKMLSRGKIKKRMGGGRQGEKNNKFVNSQDIKPK